jgi:hypothetical protein
MGSKHGAENRLRAMAAPLPLESVLPVASCTAIRIEPISPGLILPIKLHQLFPDGPLRCLRALTWHQNFADLADVQWPNP